MKRLLIVCVCTTMILLTGVVWGNPDFGPVGDPIVGGSWKQWWAGLPGETDLIAHKIASAGDVFETPGYSSINQAGWNMVIDLPTLVSMSGPAVTTIGFYVNFPGNPGDFTPADPLILDGVLFSGDTLIYTTRNTWNGSSWSYQPNAGYWTPTRADLIPAPGAILLGGIGIGLVGWLKRRRTL